MDLTKVSVYIFIITTVKSLTTVFNSNKSINNNDLELEEFNNTITQDPIGNKLNDVFKGVYTDCVLKFSYSCLQQKTLLYLEKLNDMREVSVFGDYVKFVKLNITENDEKLKSNNFTWIMNSGDTKELELLIDMAIDRFFKSHVIKFSALGRDITVPRNVEEFVGRKKKKGGAGGGHDGVGGKKKMMIMAMMCMKMKMMMMIPAMMGMMGMMSFKGMMFSMMSFIISKVMLVMKLLEKKGGAGIGGSSANADGGWPAASGSGGAWMPAGGQDFAGGGYDTNAQWQSRSILEKLESKVKEPIITYVVPAVQYMNKNKKLTTHEVRQPINYGKPKKKN